MQRGPVYVVKARGWRGAPVRLVVDAFNGRILRKHVTGRSSRRFAAGEHRKQAPLTQGRPFPVEHRIGPKVSVRNRFLCKLPHDPDRPSRKPHSRRRGHRHDHNTGRHRIALCALGLRRRQAPWNGNPASGAGGIHREIFRDHPGPARAGLRRDYVRLARAGGDRNGPCAIPPGGTFPASGSTVRIWRRF